MLIQTTTIWSNMWSLQRNLENVELLLVEYCPPLRRTDFFFFRKNQEVIKTYPLPPYLARTCSTENERDVHVRNAARHAHSMQELIDMRAPETGGKHAPATNDCLARTHTCFRIGSF